MFILDTNDVGLIMYAKGQKVESNIELWHKRFNHINFPKLQDMQSNQVVSGLSKFSGQKGEICEAC